MTSLELVSLESGSIKIRPKPVEIGAFVRGISNAVSAMAQDKRITLGSQITAEVGTVMTDPEKLERITLNLIFNALKFTAANGRVDSIPTRMTTGWCWRSKTPAWAYQQINCRTSSAVSGRRTPPPSANSRAWASASGSSKELAEVQGRQRLCHERGGQGHHDDREAPAHSPYCRGPC